MGMTFENMEYNVGSGRKRRHQDTWDDSITGSGDESGSKSDIKRRNFAVSKGASDVLVNSSAQNPPPVSARLVNKALWSRHHGAISRKRSEALLSGWPDGVFLVRESTIFPGDHTLCVRFRGRVIHYRVKWVTVLHSQDQRLTIDDEELFDNMMDLIQHYMTDADGLCTKLEWGLPERHHQQRQHQRHHQ